MKPIGTMPVLNGGISIYDKAYNTVRTEPISKKTAYRELLRRGYHPLSEQQEWLKRQIDASK